MSMCSPSVGHAREGRGLARKRDVGDGQGRGSRAPGGERLGIGPGAEGDDITRYGNGRGPGDGLVGPGRARTAGPARRSVVAAARGRDLAVDVDRGCVGPERKAERSACAKEEGEKKTSPHDDHRRPNNLDDKPQQAERNAGVTISRFAREGWPWEPLRDAIDENSRTVRVPADPLRYVEAGASPVSLLTRIAPGRQGSAGFRRPDRPLLQLVSRLGCGRGGYCQVPETTALVNVAPWV